MDWTLVNQQTFAMASNEAWKVANMIRASSKKYMSSVSELNDLLLIRNDLEKSNLHNKNKLLLENAFRIQTVFVKINEIRNARAQALNVCSDFENQFYRGTRKMLNASEKVIRETLVPRQEGDLEEWTDDVL